MVAERYNRKSRGMVSGRFNRKRRGNVSEREEDKYCV